MKRRPYRVLLVIDEQWQDPGSRILDHNYAEPALLDVASLLRIWNIPFDVLRLDQQRLELNYFLDASLQPLYGSILWLARPGHLGDMPHDWSALAAAVENHGISLLALGPCFELPGLQKVLGVTGEGTCMAALRPHQAPMTITGGHPLVAGLEDHQIPKRQNYTGRYWHICRAKAGDDAHVLARHDHFAAATIREPRPGVHAIWIGGDLATMYRRHLADSGPLLRRALTWALGYTLMRPQDDTAMLMMDDPGMVHSRMYGWHCPSMTPEQVRTCMIEPLRRHDAKLMINVISGFVNHERRLIEPSWQQQFIDDFGQRQDMPRLKASLDEGIAAGVFEVQCHGWTHLLPDLESPPGPFHDAPADGEASNNDWYGEFEDRRRGVEVPAATQRVHLRRAIEAITRDFGQPPLAFRPGGARYGRSLANHTLQIAGEMGFGMATVSDAIYLPCNDGVLEITAGAAKLVGSHDYDIHHAPDTIERMCQKAEATLGSNVRFIGAEEFTAYASTSITDVEAGLRLTYHPFHGRAFAERESQWDLTVADWLLQQSGGEVRVKVDGQDAGQASTEPQRLTVRPGIGEHRIELVTPHG